MLHVLLSNIDRASLFSVFRSLYLRQEIFSHVEEINNRLKDHQSDGGWMRPRITRKGRDIINLAHLAMISQYAMPWEFIKHYLPPREEVLLKRRVNEITLYCSHPNATLDTLLHLLKWSGDYNPTLVEGQKVNIEEIIRNGNKDIFEFFVNNYPTTIDYKRSRQWAADSGHLSILEYIDSSPPSAAQVEFDNMINLDFPAAYGHLHVLEYLHNRGEGDRGNIKGDNAIDNASCTSKLDVVKFLHYNTTNGCTTNAMDSAILYGDIELLKVCIFLHFNRTEGCSDNSIDIASECGHLDIVKFLHEHRSGGCTKRAMDKAAKNGFYSVVEWLHQIRSEGCTEDAMDMTNSFEIVKFLHTHRSEGCTTWAIDYAAWHQNLDILTFLHHNRTEGATTRAINWAAEENNINAVNFLYENRTEGCDPNIIDKICCKPNVGLDMIIFLHEKLNKQCSAKGLKSAIKNTNLDIIQYLSKQTPPDLWTQELIFPAIKRGDLNIVKFILDSRPHLNTHNAIDIASIQGHFDLVQYLHKHRAEGCTTAAMDQAARYNHFEILKVPFFLHFNRTEGCTTNAMDRAAHSGYLEIVEFLHKHRTEGCTEWGVHHATPSFKPNYNVVKYLLDNKLVPKHLIKRDQVNTVCFEVVELVNQYLDNDDENQ
ncbi:hypothetical protein DFA_04007 [Cavenderia fasciculata]|uniref:Ankyrin repeat-containing protein n=1 Tax=Cavenderia fasciculata TaxID=261658 RepID=F4Q112_CACFS|nr:uncharacterized protein DFA_04007 [Cavenderia fasciculata]EGG18513.1 hypothetical protein DFA_04007 [Cavenderia fasciculata]|eukprot:XP_004366417.1 hypothetical protein DFA_04007 [Cavenderia fasciculata]